jgi:hypothetical protein
MVSVADPCARNLGFLDCLKFNARHNVIDTDWPSSVWTDVIGDL